MKNGELRDFPINVKIKLSALWASVMFLYVYGDFFTLFLPGRIQNLMNGQSGVGATTPTQLLIFAILMTLPSLMIFLSVTLRPGINRWLNIILGAFYSAVMILIGWMSIDPWRIYYVYLAAVEVILTLMIVGYAWSWERANGEPQS